MPMHPSRPWGLYLITFLSALCAAASAVFWLLGAASVAPQEQRAAPLGAPVSAVVDSQLLARALGGGVVEAAKAAPAPTTQYQLLGVVAGPVGRGYALLVVGNAPPKAYSVGAALGEGLFLQSVSSRGAKIGSKLQGQALLELSLPTLSGS